MPLITGDITGHGAIIVVQIGVSRNRRKRLESVGFRVPEPVALRLPIDTGSFATGLVPSVFTTLQIEPFTVIPVRTPSTRRGQPHSCYQYDVSLTLVSGESTRLLPSVHVIASDDFEEEEEIQGILGRDVLDSLHFEYHGPDRRFLLAF